MSGLPIPGPSMRLEVPWAGGSASERAFCVLAPNPGPMTLDGTNTYVLAEPGARRGVVVDPGPADPAHLDALYEHLRQSDLEVGLILLTHAHLDHSEAVDLLREGTGAPVRAWRTRGADELVPGEVIALDGLEVEVVGTPGHTSDSVTFRIPADDVLLTGDTVLGRGTTVVAWPDGHLGDYLDSLSRLRDIAADAVALLPGHGPTLAQPAAVLNEYIEHRQVRLDQVRNAVAAGARTAEDVVDAVYVDIPEHVRPAALLSTRAQLEYLGVL